ncbi:hypothetical protein V2J92_25930 [Pseudomonas alliivorans]|uniref:hypothetical protein n=1 Tax=Pseudomonas alliivorans TaxID=2810613 RepID=UPI001AE62B6A|nr:hypothetical protein [Pseudomonas alliivorans]MBP0940513.1 hypothetical protein [Pseudomonas alliivorans]MEE4879369.1 hypothetical protein [Pseudomonas alliivorans]MEE4930421.1 hypothetical protein [Pseudomonas alliivorans]MEE4935369.1 hypothetical protein [Pseudomonas alliivorans]MEE4942493.1 hypothetical protein [Pseudomonas alliivorans]
MVDFKASLAQGLKAATEAEASRTEIAKVFEALNEELSEATEGKLYIELAEEIQLPNSMLNGLMGPMSHVMANAKKVPVIKCINPLVRGRSEKLCEYSMGRAGYPFQIKLDRQEWVCHDRAALENVLAELLSDPVVGERIMKVMNAR